MSDRLRQKAARLVVEVVSVVFAVLVALAVDELRQDHAERLQAEQARVAVVSELRSNLGELVKTRPSLDSMRARLAALGVSASTRHLPSHTSITLDLPDFSDAAWQTAQMTQATAHLPLQWLILVSKAYETQSLYESLRTDVIRSFASAVGDRSTAGLQRLGGELGVLQNVGDGLEAAYDSIFVSSGVDVPAADATGSGADTLPRDTMRSKDTVPRPGGTR